MPLLFHTSFFFGKAILKVSFWDHLLLVWIFFSFLKPAFSMRRVVRDRARDVLTNKKGLGDVWSFKLGSVVIGAIG